MNKTSSPLTSRERVNRVFARQDHDRVPRFESFWPETITRWQEEGLNGETDAALDLLSSDIAQICWCWPVAFPGRNDIVRLGKETRDVVDGQGKTVRYWRGKSGTPEHLGFDCDTREKWETIYKPALLNTGLQLDPEATRRNCLRERQKGRWTCLAGVEGFEQTRSLMGDEISLMAMVEAPDWVRDVSKTYTDALLRNFDAIMATGAQPDGLWIYGDMAFRSATMCSPSMYRELIWPDHKRMADWAHAHNMKMIYHTDGDVNGVMDLYVEAGFDCLQPLECKAGMDIRNLCPKYGDRMAFFGNVNVMVLMTNDRAKIEAEVRAKLAAGMATKGYIYHSDHSISPQVSWETYQFLIRLLDQYGVY
jgi:uroporphyrinogen decarboxylase